MKSNLPFLAAYSRFGPTVLTVCVHILYQSSSNSIKSFLSKRDHKPLSKSTNAIFKLLRPSRYFSISVNLKIACVVLFSGIKPNWPLWILTFSLNRLSIYYPFTDVETVRQQFDTPVVTTCKGISFSF